MLWGIRPVEVVGVKAEVSGMRVVKVYYKCMHEKWIGQCQRENEERERTTL